MGNLAAGVVVRRPVLPYGTEVPIEPGSQARVRNTVVADDTAVSVGSGEVPVLASSRLIEWCEQATVECIREHRTGGDVGLESAGEQTTVMMRVHLDHLKPASVGCDVTALATLERIEGRRYVFVVTALDPSSDVLANGRMVRVEVETAPFLASACGQGV